MVGLAWWTMKTLQSAKWAGLGFVEPRPGLTMLGLLTLASAVFASVAGAWLFTKVNKST
jgi:hypothetical protein